MRMAMAVDEFVVGRGAVMTVDEFVVGRGAVMTMDKLVVGRGAVMVIMRWGVLIRECSTLFHDRRRQVTKRRLHWRLTTRRKRRSHG